MIWAFWALALAPTVATCIGVGVALLVQRYASRRLAKAEREYTDAADHMLRMSAEYVRRGHPLWRMYAAMSAREALCALHEVRRWQAWWGTHDPGWINLVG